MVEEGRTQWASKSKYSPLPAELETLRKELTLLVNLCRGAEAGCPIIEGLETPDKRK